MNIYTKQGDRGKTSLMNGISVSKSDDRIELLGTIDELSSHLGLAKVLCDEPLRSQISQIQKNLIQIMAKIADPRNLDYNLDPKETTALEESIDQMEASFPRAKEFILYGGCEQSARLDVARAVARRAERRFRKVEQNYGCDTKAMQYINRLSDFLYMAARFADHQAVHTPEGTIKESVIQNLLKNQ
ncbi:cob(I)yrinic acid a,c-diamide adenosyltransferase [Mediterraneibacter massiliensis]|uniref:cob(I)yrinic acid a,c-diamide adenosyltransferase n=1 Tax=Mediterraneibacter massiliensis TaxID=1720300 RepID=UPI0024AE7609|nr:cob(I)yrinic acid a,c-diamide adenosyltransferase [Mediterraneibacter massiliensis]